MDEALNDKQILASWHKNADPCIKAVQNKQIESRRLVTGQAIIDTALSFSANSVLDAGSGEGWKIRPSFA